MDIEAGVECIFEDRGSNIQYSPNWLLLGFGRVPLMNRLEEVGEIPISFPRGC